MEDLSELKVLVGEKVQSHLDRTQRDLSTLIAIATHISSIRSLDSLQWQLLGMIFDVLPADRGAFLFVPSLATTSLQSPGIVATGQPSLSW